MISCEKRDDTLHKECVYNTLFLTSFSHPAVGPWHPRSFFKPWNVMKQQQIRYIRLTSFMKWTKTWGSRHSICNGHFGIASMFWSIGLLILWSHIWQFAAIREELCGIVLQWTSRNIPQFCSSTWMVGKWQQKHDTVQMYCRQFSFRQVLDLYQ